MNNATLEAIFIKSNKLNYSIDKRFQFIDFKKPIRAPHEIASTQSRNDDFRYFDLACLYAIALF